ncbi:sigma-70 family RNA polymerase sigma factor [Limnoglobus roseus]|uniref:RNA polymerase sigma factor n=1 Tax=Limnoglobus roseus TaxID=2598579 RepID=A0A5C1ANQ1_9BACT|nr:sigma-70 family RNA polymerase sigma factor [Limnoglobus roseus]QEL19753.1 RNA polymerase sigma factor [Limnoglobus roseus]
MPYASLSEVDLLDRLHAGDQAALAELFARHRDKLRRMVQVRMDQRLNGRVAASDVLQEAYIDALKRYPHFFDKPNQNFFGWLRLVVGQRLADLHREHVLAKRRDVRQEKPMNVPVNPGTSACLAAILVAGLTSPSGVADRNEQYLKLEAALDELDEVDREVLALRHFEELSNTDTASVLGIQPAAASKRYVRALTRLKQILEGVA